MNQEKLFRAWDKKEKKMIHFGLYSLLVDGFEKDKRYLRHYKNGMKDLKVMQFVGLEDWHGNRIFEGDIVQFVQPSFLTIGLDIDTQQLVENMHHMYDHCLEKGVDYTDVKVIGNIYENPELAYDAEDNT